MNNHPFNSVSAPADSVVDQTEVNSPSVSQQNGAPDFAQWAKLNNVILLSAESHCPGVTARVTTADFSAIVYAVVNTIGIGLSPIKYRTNPPPSLLRDIADAVEKTTSTMKAVGAGSANLSSTAEKLRGPSGKPRRSTAVTKVTPRAKSRVKKVNKVSKAAAPSQGKADKPAVVSKTGTSIAKSAGQSSVSDETSKKSVRDRIITKALRSFRGSGPQAKVARGQGLTEESLTAKINALSDVEIASLKKSGVPALAFTGVFDNIELKSWSAEVETDVWLRETMTRKERSLRVEKSSAGVPFARYERQYMDIMDPKEIAKDLSGAIKCFCLGQVTPTFAQVVKSASRTFYDFKPPVVATDPLKVKLTFDVPSGNVNTPPLRHVEELWLLASAYNVPAPSGRNFRHEVSFSSKRDMLMSAVGVSSPWTLSAKKGSGAGGNAKSKT